MEITLLGTGGAWGLPELSCDCQICQEMRQRGERRTRTSLLFSNKTTLLVDCGPDFRAQIERQPVPHLDGVLITHEHTDHYMGLDELFVYKRIAPRGSFGPIPLYVTAQTWDVIRKTFQYLEDLGVIKVQVLVPGQRFQAGEFEILPFKTDHGATAQGSVGLMVGGPHSSGRPVRMVYTSDFKDIPDMPADLIEPDYLFIQSFWLNEPVHNRPSHMSFQRAMDFIERLNPKLETILVHIGDADRVPEDPTNIMTKKYEPKDPLRPSPGKAPYPIPRCQVEWQTTVDQIMADHGLPHKVSVGYDGLRLRI